MSDTSSDIFAPPPGPRITIIFSSHRKQLRLQYSTKANNESTNTNNEQKAKNQAEALAGKHLKHVNDHVTAVKKHCALYHKRSILISDLGVNLDEKTSIIVKDGGKTNETCTMLVDTEDHCEKLRQALSLPDEHFTQIEESGSWKVEIKTKIEYGVWNGNLEKKKPKKTSQASRTVPRMK
jgi:hypothetical protein